MNPISIQKYSKRFRMCTNIKLNSKRVEFHKIITFFTFTLTYTSLFPPPSSHFLCLFSFLLTLVRIKFIKNKWYSEKNRVRIYFPLTRQTLKKKLFFFYITQRHSQILKTQQKIADRESERPLNIVLSDIFQPRAFFNL